MTASRARLLYGTDEPAPAPRVLRAGPLSAELEAGNLRYIRIGGVEMIRAISFLVRSRAWATFAPEIEGLHVEEADDAFAVRYQATIRDGEAVLRYAARIEGRADGTLRFAAEAEAETAFVTCRTGFVVLHPIEGVAGEPVEVEHADGTRESTHFPALIDPVQPMLNLRALTHGFAPGARVTCRMEGDVWEMEDQRNWTDASYKTYSRPLVLPWPFTLAKGETLSQSVTLTVTGPAPAAVADRTVRLSIAEPLGPMPTLALGCTPDEAAAALPLAARLKPAGVAGLVCRFDPRLGHDAAALGPMRELAGALGAEVELQLVVPSLEGFAEDIAAAAREIAASGVQPTAISVIPAADLISTPPGSQWPPCPPLDAVLRAARAAFPGVRLGGGMFTHFTELNRKRPPRDLIDFVTFATTPVVHAGDDRSVMESLEALPAIAASAHAIAGDRPLRVGPSGIGMRDNPNGPGPLPNPADIRLAMAGRDPRQRGLFNAAFTLGLIARFAVGGVERLALSAPVGDYGILGPDGPYPVFHVIAGCAALRGQTLRRVRTSNEHDVLALLAGDTLFLANLTDAPVGVVLADIAAPAQLHMLDAACGPDWAGWRALPSVDPITQLDAFAVAMLAPIHLTPLH